MMLFGDKGTCAVEVNIDDVFEGWVFGSYQLWVRGVSIGDEADHSVDLKGCWSWMRDFIERRWDRYEPDLYEMDKRQVFLRLANWVSSNMNPHRFSKELYENSYPRFHISRIGMSSFDRFTLLLVESQTGMQRLVWQEGQGDIQDAYLGANQLESAFAEAVVSLEGIMLAAGDKV